MSLFSRIVEDSEVSGHWVTIGGRRVFVKDKGPKAPPGPLVGFKTMLRPSDIWPKKLKEQKRQAESECDGRKTNKPWLTPSGPKKRAVCVQDGGKAKIVRFGDKSLEIKRDDPGRRKNFRARHGCDDPGPKTKARYWSCKYWAPGKTASQLDLGETTDLPTAYGITRPMTGRTGLGSSPDSPALQRFGRRPLRISLKK